MSSEIFHQLAEGEKKNYLRFVHDLGERGLVREFVMPDSGFSLWWSSRVVEKSPLKSDSYRELIALLASGGAVRPKRTVIERLASSIPAQFAAGIFRICEFLIRCVYVKAVMRVFGGKARSLCGNEQVIVSYFPLVNEIKAGRGDFENGYIPPYHRACEADMAGRYSHVLYQVNMAGRGFAASVALAAKFSKRQSVFMLEEFFGLQRIFRVFFYYMRFSLKYILSARRIKGLFVYRYAGKDLDVSDIFSPDLVKSFCGSVLASGILHLYIFEEMVKRLKAECRVVCVCEMQWWERALYFYTAKRRITTVGVQHTIVPELLLNYYGDDADFDPKRGGHPFPDHMAAVGRMSRDALVNGGWPRERVFIWGAQRFEDLNRMSEAPVAWNSRLDSFLCIFSVNDSDSARLLRLIREAFSAKGGYKILIKGHPAADINRLMARIDIALDDAIFECTTKPLHDIVPKVRGVILVSSSSCLYALRSATPVIVPVFSDRIDYNPLSYVTDIPVFTYSPEDLRSACDTIASSAESPCRQERFRQALEDYLYFPKDEGEYLEKIRAL